jgi:hypothetical protein
MQERKFKVEVVEGHTLLAKTLNELRDAGEHIAFVTQHGCEYTVVHIRDWHA